jgi:hypothetical protein
MKAKVASVSVDDESGRGLVVLRLGAENGCQTIGCNVPSATIDGLARAGFIGTEVDLEFRITRGFDFAVLK